MKIGIIGGAGPVAGAIVFERLIKAFQKTGCKNDWDFPEIIMISFPFSDMLSDEMDPLIIQKELADCFSRLSDCDQVVIACNTLHNFIISPPPNFINMTHLVECEKSLVLCTSTSRNLGLYKGVFPLKQEKINECISEVLEGLLTPSMIEMIIREEQKRNPSLKSLILGCTELSQLNHEKKIHVEGIKIVDPIDLVVERIIKNHVKNTS